MCINFLKNFFGPEREKSKYFKMNDPQRDLYIFKNYLFCRYLPTNINRSDYSFALEKLHPGMAGNDKTLFRL